ncbi:MAG: AI-2E family transporter [Leptospirales bacterium]|jgi:predicted PurR-regulated permease PerM
MARMRNSKERSNSGKSKNKPTGKSKGPGRGKAGGPKDANQAGKKKAFREQARAGAPFEAGGPDGAPESRDELLRRLANIWFVVLFLATFGLIVVMAWPFITSIIFALILAGSFYPLMRYFVERRGWTRTFSALIVSAIIVLAVFLPVVYIVVRLAQEVGYAYKDLSAVITTDSMEDFFFGSGYGSVVGRQIFDFLNLEYNRGEIQRIVLDFAGSMTNWAYERISGFISNVLYLLLDVIVMLAVIFGILQQAPTLRDFMFRLSPLPEEDERLIINRFNQMNYVTLVCNGVGGILQGTLAGVAFWVLGFKAVLLWTVIMSVLAFIPLVGISFVYVPASIFLLVTGNYVAAAGLFIYCSLVSVVTENWFKPIFMGNQVSINSLLVFLSIVGGMAVFGTAGIFYGPLIIIIFLTFVELYHERYEKNLSR